jgi:endonuclease/exonuclease/phosphatase family metal-dependent hydrolase
MSKPLRILTLNVWFSQRRQAERFAGQLDAFARADADVICLQEVNSSYLAALARAQASAHPWLASYELAAPDLCAGPHYGVAMLVRRALSPVFSRRPFEGSEMGRELLLARLHSAALGSLAVGCVHLESLDAAGARAAQLQDCAEALAGEGAAVLCGDLNFCSLWDFGAMKQHLNPPQAAARACAFSPVAFALAGAGSPWGAALEAAAGGGQGGSGGGASAARALEAASAGGAASPGPASPRPAALLPASPLLSRAGSTASSAAPCAPAAAFAATENAGMERALPGWADAWPALHGALSLENDAGFTFDSLRNPMLEHPERMRYDRVLYRLPLERFALTRCDLVGTEPLPAASAAPGSSGTPARDAPPCFLSDHFGVLAEWSVAPPPSTG